MIKENPWKIPPNAPACMEKHLCAAQYRAGKKQLAGITGGKHVVLLGCHVYSSAVLLLPYDKIMINYNVPTVFKNICVHKTWNGKIFFNIFVVCFSLQMARCCWEPPASLAETGKDPFGSTANRSKPPARGSAKLVCRLRLGSQISSGWLKREWL